MKGNRGVLGGGNPIVLFVKILYNKGENKLSLESAIVVAAINGELLAPKISESVTYKHWVGIDDGRWCLQCEKNHGKIWYISQTPVPKPPIHPKCRCAIELMQSIKAGTATINGEDGADWMLKYVRKLPEYYVDSYEASLTGWRPKKF